MYHASPWCPRFPAIVWVDYNAARRDDVGCYHDLVSDHSFSRPVTIGEYVVIHCEEMITWGRAEKRDGKRIVRDDLAVEGPWPTICYAPEYPRFAPQEPEGAK